MLTKKLSLRKRAAQKLNKYWSECAPHIFNQSIYLYLRQQNTSLVCKSTQSNIGIVILHVNDSLCNLTNTNIWIEENWTVKYKMFLHQTQKLDSRSMNKKVADYNVAYYVCHCIINFPYFIFIFLNRQRNMHFTNIPVQTLAEVLLCREVTNHTADVQVWPVLKDVNPHKRVTKPSID